MGRVQSDGGVGGVLGEPPLFLNLIGFSVP